MKRIRSLFQKYHEIIRYLFWGVMTTLVSWVTYSLFIRLLNSVFAANVLSWICAVLFAFVTNKIWVFRSRERSVSAVLAELWKFIAARLATGVVEIVGVPLLVSAGLNQKILGIEGMTAKVIVTIVVVILNYILSKLFVFKSRK